MRHSPCSTFVKRALDAYQDTLNQRRDPRFRMLEQNGFENLADIRPYLGSHPTSLWDELKGGLFLGGTNLGKLYSGLGSHLPGDTGEYFKMKNDLYRDRGNIVRDWLSHAPDPQPWNPVSGKGVAFATEQLPDLANPFGAINKVRLVANQAPRLIQGAVKGVNHLIQNSPNLAYHYANGYLPEQSKADGVAGAGSNILGEAVENRMTHGKGVAGNLVGAGMQWARNMWSGDAVPKPKRTLPGQLPVPLLPPKEPYAPWPPPAPKPTAPASLANR